MLKRAEAIVENLRLAKVDFDANSLTDYWFKLALVDVRALARELDQAIKQMQRGPGYPMI